MTLRKCPACKDTVGADSPECPRCGINFRQYLIRRTLVQIGVLALLAWAVAHFLLHRV